MLSSIAVATIALIVAMLAFTSISSGQTPGPTEEAPPVCPPNRPDPRPAGEVGAGLITVQMPDGRYYVLEAPPGSGLVNVCLEGAGGVRLGSDCAEVSRYVEGDADALDSITESCVPSPSIVPSATPTSSAASAPIATVTPTAMDASPIRPPDTGSAGLR